LLKVFCEIPSNEIDQMFLKPNLSLGAKVHIGTD
jgi:hypothetical protein